jgi:hypothetical protein
MFSMSVPEFGMARKTRLSFGTTAGSTDIPHERIETFHANAHIGAGKEGPNER